MEPDDHAGKNIDRQRQPGANAHRLARRLVHQEKIDLRVVDLHDSKGRDAKYWPGTAVVALTPLLSLRFSAATRLSIRSTRALIVRRSGNGSWARAHLALTCSIK